MYANCHCPLCRDSMLLLFLLLFAVLALTIINIADSANDSRNPVKRLETTSLGQLYLSTHSLFLFIVKCRVPNRSNDGEITIRGPTKTKRAQLQHIFDNFPDTWRQQRQTQARRKAPNGNLLIVERQLINVLHASAKLPRHAPVRTSHHAIIHSNQRTVKQSNSQVLRQYAEPAANTCSCCGNAFCCNNIVKSKEYTQQFPR